MSAAKPALVGVFVLSGLLLAVAAILLFGGMRLFSPAVHAVVYFRGSVANLDIGAPVTFRGVRVGTVTAVTVNLDMTDLTARIPVFLDLYPSRISLRNGTGGQMEASFDRLLKAGLRAQLTMQSLVTGQLRVDLDLLPDAEATTVGGDSGRTEIPSVPSQLQTIEEEIAALPLKQIAENASQALISIRQVADTLPPRIGPMADSFKQTSDAARVTLEDIDRLAVAGQHQLTANGDELKRVLAASDRTARDAEAMIASLQEMTAPNSPMRSDIQATLRDLAASASSLRGFTHQIERDPSALLMSGRAAR